MTLSDGTNVVLKKPILANQLFSGTAKGKLGIELGQEASDRVNFAANQQLFSEFVKQNKSKMPDGSLDELYKAARMLSVKMDSYIPKTDESLYLVTRGVIDFSGIPLEKLSDTNSIALFESDEFKAYQKEVIKVLLTQLKGAEGVKEQNEIKSMIYLLLGKEVDLSKEVDLNGAIPIKQFQETLERPDYSFDLSKSERANIVHLEIYRNNVLEALNLSSGKQCKSGTDRTGVGIALALAQADYKKKNGVPFMPGKVISDDFKKIFKNYLLEFGLSMTPETKGVFGLKIGGNPTLDVLLSEKDIKEGQLTEPELLLGTTSSSVKKEKKAEESKYSQEDKKTAVKAVNEKLQDLLSKPGLEVFDENLQFKIHISELEINKDYIEGINGEITLLKNGLKTKPHDNVSKIQIYLLERVVAIYEESEKAKTAAAIAISPEAKEAKIKESISELKGQAKDIRELKNIIWERNRDRVELLLKSDAKLPLVLEKRIDKFLKEVIKIEPERGLELDGSNLQDIQKRRNELNFNELSKDKINALVDFYGRVLIPPSPDELEKAKIQNAIKVLNRVPKEQMQEIYSYFVRFKIGLKVEELEAKKDLLSEYQIVALLECAARVKNNENLNK